MHSADETVAEYGFNVLHAYAKIDIYITANMLIYYHIWLDWSESQVDCSAYNFTNTKDRCHVLYNAIYAVLDTIVAKAPAGALWQWSYI